jgi:hypothetical protein
MANLLPISENFVRYLILRLDNRNKTILSPLMRNGKISTNNNHFSGGQSGSPPAPPVRPTDPVKKNLYDIFHRWFSLH